MRILATIAACLVLAACPGTEDPPPGTDTNVPDVTVDGAEDGTNNPEVDATGPDGDTTGTDGDTAGTDGDTTGTDGDTTGTDGDTTGTDGDTTGTDGDTTGTDGDTTGTDGDTTGTDGDTTGTDGDGGETVSSGDGETCDTAIVVAALPYTDSGDTTNNVSDHDTTVCAGSGTPVGQDAPDVVYSFTPTATGNYNANLTNATTTGPPAIIIVATDCAGGIESCTAAANVENGALIVSLTAGQTYFFIVDSFGTEAGSYTFTLDEECIPDCTGVLCGVDSVCGLFCGGTCAAGEACDTGVCTDVSATVGDSCANPNVLSALPTTEDGDTSGFSNAHQWTPGTCGGAGSAQAGLDASDEVWQLDTTLAGIYTITLESATDQAFYIFTDCADATGSCFVGADAQFGGANEVSTPTLEAGTTYFIVVDGFQAGEEGPYTLTVEEPCVPSCGAALCGGDGCGGSCGDCAAGESCNTGVCVTGGDTCDDALIIDPAILPVTINGDTTAANNDYSAPENVCSGSNSEYGSTAGDNAHAFTPTVDGIYTISVSPSFDATLYVTTDCADINETTCLDSSDDDPETVTLPMVSGTTYYFIVDGYSDGTGTYSLAIDPPCVPDCSGKVCGDDGCGTQCGAGCTAGQVCDDTGATCNDVPNDACETATELVVDTPVSGDTSGDDLANDYAVTSGQCGINDSFGASKDMAFVFTPAADGPFTFTLTPTGFTAGLAIVRSCDNFEETCLGGFEATADDEVVTVSLPLLGGVTYYAIVDGSASTDEGAFELAVTTCTPQCTGFDCGDDSCGGDCGACGATELCDDQQLCVAAPPGNTCADALVVDAVPYSFSGTTTNTTDDYSSTAGTCGTDALGGGANDVAHAITPTVDGVYTIDVSVTGWDAAIYVTTDCGDISDTTCLGSGDDPETVTVSMVAGTTYYIVVDGYSSANGDYTMTIDPPCIPQCMGKSCGDDGCGGSCGDCADGEACNAGQCLAGGQTCLDALVIDAANLPATITSTTTEATNDYTALADVCATTYALGGGAGDIAHSFTPDADGEYTFTLSPSSFDAALYVTTDCADISETTCLDSSDSGSSGGSETIAVSLVAGTTYFVIVDGYSAGEGDYSLLIEPPCVPDCGSVACGDDGCGGSCGDCGAGEFCNTGQCLTGGDTCVDALVIDPSALPVEFAADTTTATNNYTAPENACTGTNPEFGAGAGDRIHSFTPTVDGIYTVNVAPNSGFDSAIYVTTDCADIGASCLDSSDGTQVSLAMVSGTTYFIVVDGNAADTDTGGYTLTMDPPCIPECGAQECGLDPVCGAVDCGACSAGNYCDAVNTCQPTPTGSACDAPFVVDASNLPFSGSGDTSLATDTFRDGGCATSVPAGQAPDEVWAFTPVADGSFTFTFTPTSGNFFDGVLYVVEPCTEGVVPDTCLAGTNDTIDNEAESVTVNLVAGTTYYFVVDSYWATETTTYNVDVVQN